MHSRGFTTGEFVAQQAEREDIAEIQAFIESNPEYWLLVHGHLPLADDAAKSFDWHPPVDMRYSEHLSFLVRHRPTREILAQIDVATDLLATGVYHLGFFILQRERTELASRTDCMKRMNGGRSTVARAG